MTLKTTDPRPLSGLSSNTLSGIGLYKIQAHISMCFVHVFQPWLENIVKIQPRSFQAKQEDIFLAP